MILVRGDAVIQIDNGCKGTTRKNRTSKRLTRHDRAAIVCATLEYAERNEDYPCSVETHDPFRYYCGRLAGHDGPHVSLFRVRGSADGVAFYVNRVWK